MNLRQEVIAYARNALEQISNIHAVAEIGKAATIITVATSHTQARYVLPQMMKRFAARYPKVQISLMRGDPGQTAERVLSGEAIGVSTEASIPPSNIIMTKHRLSRA